MPNEHDRIVLLQSLPKEGLEAGDVGTIVHIYPGGQAYEVEFVALNGQTRAVATIEADRVRPVTRRDMAHAREMLVI